MKFNNIEFDTYFNNYPDKNGYFGKFGGVYIDEKLKNAMEEITEAESAYKVLGAKCEQAIPYSLPENYGERILAVVTKVM